MTREGPGKSDREGISPVKLMKMFPTGAAAREWFEARIWPHGPHCPHCGSANVQSGIKHRSMTHRCRDCDGRPMFSLKTGNIMEGSKLGYQTWAIAIHLVTTSLKGVSSMKLHRDLETTRKSAWHLAHRLRKAFEAEGGLFAGPVEADGTYVGGKRKNMPKAKRKTLEGRGAVGKAAGAGAKERATNRVNADALPATDGATLQGFVRARTEAGATVHTDDAAACRGMAGFEREAVKHAAGAYARGMAHTDGMESFRAMLKRGCHGACHHMSPKHPGRYVDEFSGRHNVREDATEDQMAHVAERMVSRRLRYRGLAA